MARTGEDDVREIINNGADIGVQVCIETASALVDLVESNDSSNTLNAKTLRLIETWLAAHFYGIRDPQYQEKRTEKAEAVYQGRTDLGFDSNYWGQTAMRLDVTGYLSRINDEAKKGGKRQPVISWLGKAPSAQINYVDRD